MITARTQVQLISTINLFKMLGAIVLAGIVGWLAGPFLPMICYTIVDRLVPHHHTTMTEILLFDGVGGALGAIFNAWCGRVFACCLFVSLTLSLFLPRRTAGWLCILVSVGGFLGLAVWMAIGLKDWLFFLHSSRHELLLFFGFPLLSSTLLNLRAVQNFRLEAAP